MGTEPLFLFRSVVCTSSGCKPDLPLVKHGRVDLAIRHVGIAHDDLARHAHATGAAVGGDGRSHVVAAGGGAGRGKVEAGSVGNAAHASAVVLAPPNAQHCGAVVVAIG